MSQPTEQFLDVSVQAQSPPDVETSDDDVSIEDVISAFLDVNPTPTDDQIHTLAALLDCPFEEFEAIIYEMFSDYVDDPEGYADSVVEQDIDNDGEVDDPVEVLLVCFFAYRPDPSDIEIHQLAGLIGMTPEELEEILYAMLARANDSEFATTEEDATEPCEQDDVFPYQMDQLHTP